MRFRYATIVGLVLIAIVAGAVWRMNPAKDSVSAWTTQSPLIQNGVRLIAIQPEPPSEVGRKAFSLDEPIQHAWFEVTDKSLELPKPHTVGRSFAIVGKDGTRAYLDESLLGVEWDMSEPKGKEKRPDKRYIDVAVPLDYGPNFWNGKLIALANDKPVAEWQLSGMPKPVRQMADKVAPVTVAHAMGYRFQIDDKPIAYYQLSEGKTDWHGGWRTWIKIEPETEEAKKSTDQLDYRISIPKTTWRTYEAPLLPGYSGSQNHIMVGQSSSFYCDAKVAEIEIEVKRSRTYDEPIVLNDLWIETYGDPTGATIYRCRFARSATAGTPSGIALRTLTNQHTRLSAQHSLSLPVDLLPGASNVDLPNSPLCRSTGKKVDIFLANPGIANGPTGVSKNVGEQGYTALVPFMAPYRKAEYFLPKLELVVRQRAIIETGTVRFVVPIVKASSPTIVDQSKTIRTKPSKSNVSNIDGAH